MKFVLGGTPGAVTPSPSLGAERSGPRATTALIANDEYIVSPRKAKVTFTSVVFKDAAGVDLGTSTFTSCVVTYDRSLASGSTLLDCPFTVPAGEVAQMILYYSKAIEIQVSDATVGIYSDAASTTKFSTTAPAGGATLVPFTITIGDANPSRGTPIIFATPVTIVEGSTPSLYVTVDMIHTVQLSVNAGGTTLTMKAGNDPIAVFGGLTPGSSSYYSGAASAEAYKVQGVPSLRIFNDQAGKPLMALIGPVFCGADGGSKAAWATPPAEAHIGGWLGKDATGTISWALPTTDVFTTYDAYYVMPEVTTVGGTTTLKCKATASPPAPTDGKTYASGAPAISAPDKSIILKLISK